MIVKVAGSAGTSASGRHGPLLLFVGGPAGAGKSTLARAWCATRERAVHIELDEVRHLIVAGHADPQQPGPVQGEQYALSIRASLALARTFLDGGYDVAVDDVLEPAAFERLWTPLLEADAGVNWRVVVVVPALDTVLERSRGREKRVLEAHSRAQHEACSDWPAQYRVDTTGLSVEESLTLVRTLTGT